MARLLLCAVAQGGKDSIDGFPVRAVVGLDGNIGLPIDRITLFHQGAEDFARIAVSQQRSGVAPRAALDQEVELGAEPDGDRLVGEQLAGERIDEGAAAGGQHLRSPIEQPGDDAALTLAKRVLAMAFEEIGDAAARRGLDLGVGVGEFYPQLGREPPSDRRLSGAHEADKNNGAIDQAGGGVHGWRESARIPTPVY